MTWKPRGFATARIAAHIFQRVTASCTLLWAALGHLWGWIIQPDCSSCSNGLIRLHKNLFFLLQIITQIFKSLGVASAFAIWRSFSFLNKGSESRINECAEVCANMWLWLWGPPWVRVVATSRIFAGTTLSPGQYQMSTIKCFTFFDCFQCLSVAKSGHCTIMHGRYDDNCELSLITLFVFFRLLSRKKH